MTAPKRALASIPFWPRLLSVEEAARYVGVSVTTFTERIGDPWPAGIRIGRRKLFDRLALDRAVDGLSPLEPESPAHDLERGRRDNAGGQVAPR